MNTDLFIFTRRTKSIIEAPNRSTIPKHP